MFICFDNLQMYMCKCKKPYIKVIFILYYYSFVGDVNININIKMIDKLLLNNQIISNKKKILQAKINTISKVVNKIRKLKEIIENKPENVKNNTKLRKTTEILNCLKKMRPSEIVRQGLVNEKKPSAIITNSNSTPEEIAAAMIWSHKNLVEYFEQLKNLMNFDNNNPMWKEEVLEISKRKQKFLKVEEKKQKRQERKEKNALTLKREEWLLDNNEEKDKFCKKTIPTKEGEWFVEIMNDIPITDVKISTLSSNNAQIRTPKTNKDKPIIKLFEPVVKPESKKLSQDKYSDKDDKVEQVKTAVDSFFFTESGENYVSTAVIERVQPEAQNNGIVRKDRRAYMHKENYYNRNQNGNKRLGHEKPQTSFKNGENKNFNKNHLETNYSEIETIEKLHPSWAAKQKLKTIHKFSGKKIEFDEDGVVATKIESKNHININEIDLLTLQNQEKVLHPSWVAKQKLKPSITVFQGKKVIFDD